MYKLYYTDASTEKCGEEHDIVSGFLSHLAPHTLIIVGSMAFDIHPWAHYGLLI